jgi:hypothetical protein
MLHNQEDLRLRPLSVRDGQLAAVTCQACGCRLQATGEGEWRHFGALNGRDARGDTVACVELVHDAMGRVAIPA